MTKSEIWLGKWGEQMEKNKGKSKLIEELLSDVVYFTLVRYDLQQLDSSKICKIMKKVKPEFQKIIDDFKESVAVSEKRLDVMIECNIESLEKLLQDWKDI